MRLPAAGQAAGGIERAETGQQGAGLVQCRRGRRIDEGERRRVGNAPGGTVEDQRR